MKVFIQDNKVTPVKISKRKVVKIILIWTAEVTMDVFSIHYAGLTDVNAKNLVGFGTQNVIVVVKIKNNVILYFTNYSK